MMTDDLFRNMKAQMEPSDDVIADLLAKIAAESGSPVTENNNLVQFPGPAAAGLQGKAADASAAAAAVLQTDEPPHARELAKKRLSKKKKKSIWYYGTAAVACVIVFISTFAVLDQSGDPDQPGTVSDLLSRITGSDSLTDPDNTGGEGQTPDGTAGDDQDQEGTNPSGSDGQDGTDPDDGDSDGNDDNNDNDGSTDGDGSDPGKGKKDDHENDNSGKTDSNSPGSDPGNNGPNDDPDDPVNQSGGQTQPSGPSKPSKPTSPSREPDNGKVTPGASGTSDIPWTSEIMYASEVASINISGSNYVVDSTVSTSDLSGTIETVTIDLPSTSSTNATKVQAKVKSLKKVSSNAMVALDVEGFTQPLVYTNADYSPSTLGELVSDLGLEGNTKFSSTVRSQISRVGYSSNHTYHKDIGSAVWSYLLSNSGAERASYNSFNSGTVKVLFTSGSNPTGAQMQFGVSDNGYLYVSMTGGKRFTFRIGSGQAQSFIEYVTGEPVDATKSKE